MSTDERLTRIEVTQEQTTDLVREIHAHVVGKPGKDGLTTRVAKVEQRQALFTRIFALLGTTIVGLAVWLVRGRT